MPPAPSMETVAATAAAAAGGSSACLEDDMAQWERDKLHRWAMWRIAVNDQMITRLGAPGPQRHAPPQSSSLTEGVFQISLTPTSSLYGGQPSVPETDPLTAKEMYGSSASLASILGDRVYYTYGLPRAIISAQQASSETAADGGQADDSISVGDAPSVVATTTAGGGGLRLHGNEIDVSNHDDSRRGSKGEVVPDEVAMFKAAREMLRRQGGQEKHAARVGGGGDGSGSGGGGGGGGGIGGRAGDFGKPAVAKRRLKRINADDVGPPTSQVTSVSAGIEGNLAPREREPSQPGPARFPPDFGDGHKSAFRPVVPRQQQQQQQRRLPRYPADYGEGGRTPGPLQRWMSAPHPLHSHPLSPPPSGPSGDFTSTRPHPSSTLPPPHPHDRINRHRDFTSSASLYYSRSLSDQPGDPRRLGEGSSGVYGGDANGSPHGGRVVALTPDMEARLGRPRGDRLQNGRGRFLYARGQGAVEERHVDHLKTSMDLRVPTATGDHPPSRRVEGHHQPSGGRAGADGDSQFKMRENFDRYPTPPPAPHRRASGNSERGSDRSDGRAGEAAVGMGGQRAGVQEVRVPPTVPTLDLNFVPESSDDGLDDKDDEWRRFDDGFRDKASGLSYNWDESARDAVSGVPDYI